MTSKIFDSHCHYNLEPLFSNDNKVADQWQHHWTEAQNQGVASTVVVGTTVDSSRLGVDIAQQSDQLWASVGIHPVYAPNTTENLSATVPKLEALLSQPHSKVVAIGEVGLDYFRLPSSAAEQAAVKQQQRQALAAQLELANTHQLPVILHVRDRQLPDTPTPDNAYWDTLQLVQDHYHWQRPVILHCVSGPPAYVNQFVSLGAYVGCAANVTYPSAEAIRSLITQVPADRLVLETDAPYLPPQEYRGQICQPSMIAVTAEFVTHHFSVSSQQLWENTHAVFNLPLAH